MLDLHSEKQWSLTMLEPLNPEIGEQYFFLALAPAQPESLFMIVGKTQKRGLPVRSGTSH